MSRGPTPTKVRLRRLLVMLPWLMERGSASIEEMTARFHVSRAELERDLTLASMCGLPPYVDELIDLWIDEGNVHAGVKRLFTRPLRLTPTEAFRLLTAVEAALSLRGADPDGALARAAAKLRRHLGSGVSVALDRPPFLDAVQQAVERRERVAVRYWSADRDEPTERVLAPHAVFLDRGNWYVVADDSLSGEERRFRVDRIDELTPTGERFEPRDVQVPAGTWFEPADGTPVVLRLPEAGRWVAERYPVTQVEEGLDGVIVHLVVVSESWLARLLLRVGPEAEVLEPAGWRDLAARTARRLLERYERR